MCPHTVDGQVHSAAGWAGERQSAARWSARSFGAHFGKRFRRRQRRAGHRSQGGTAPPTQRVPCDPQARAGLSKSGQESHRACAQCRHSGPMSGSTPGIESSPHRQAPVMRCTRLPFPPGHPSIITS
ncbi:hypothetical protein TcCL_ESM03489 [Trypanosoma cruzi]|nr:hypothetical protein TcCL_ESM03489 [Trypanosoma cruzi]